MVVNQQRRMCCSAQNSLFPVLLIVSNRHRLFSKKVVIKIKAEIDAGIRIRQEPTNRIMVAEELNSYRIGYN